MYPLEKKSFIKGFIYARSVIVTTLIISQASSASVTTSKTLKIVLGKEDHRFLEKNIATIRATKTKPAI